MYKLVLPKVEPELEMGHTPINLPLFKNIILCISLVIVRVDFVDIFTSYNTIL